jgi:hypothetical protein
MGITHLLLMMGRASYLPAGMGKVGSGRADFRVFYAAALGNYAELDQVLAEMERLRLANRAQSLSSAVILNGINQGVLDQLPLLPRVLANYAAWTRLQRAMDDLARPEAEVRTLRGIMALEQGDTAAALSHLAGALQAAGPDAYFQDRAIAERYVELLRANR